MRGMKHAESHRTLRQQISDEMRAAMCNGKTPLEWAQAKAILDRTPRKGRTKTAYHCPVCRAWHIGGPLRKKKSWRPV